MSKKTKNINKNQIASDELHVNSLQDFVESVGTAELSKANTMAYNNRYSSVTLNRALITQSYVEHGILQTLIDQPVDDAFRGGITIRSDELSPDDIKALQNELDHTDVIQTYAQAIKWMRLFGGSGIIINSGQKTDEPLDINKIKKDQPLEFYAADRWELSYTPAGMSALDQFSIDKLECPYNYYGKKLHKTHVIKLIGKMAPSLIRGQFGGWGMSELERVVRDWNMYVKHQAVTFEVLDEAKVDVVKIEGFNSAIATANGAQKTAQRISLAAKIKNYQNALVLDKNDEFEQKTLSFGGLSEILNQIRIGLAADLRMPMTKLFGLSASGFNSGEDDIENYNCMVESEIRSKCKKGLIIILQILCKKLFDYVPEHISFEFKPLREMSTNEQSVIKTDNLSRIVSAFTSGLVTSERAAELINEASIFDSEISPKESMDLEELTNLGDVDYSQSSPTSRRGRGLNSKLDINPNA